MKKNKKAQLVTTNLIWIKNPQKKINSVLESDLEKRNALYKDPELYGEEAPDSQATPWPALISGSGNPLIWS